MDADLEYAEDYFVKGDTIYSSFQGNQPYSKFVIQPLIKRREALQTKLNLKLILELIR